MSWDTFQINRSMSGQSHNMESTLRNGAQTAFLNCSNYKPLNPKPYQASALRKQTPGEADLITLASVVCRPMAKPSNTEWRERERKSMKERKDEWAFRSTWTWWPLPSRSFTEWCPPAWPWPAGDNRGVLSSSLCLSLKVRTIFSRIRTVKKPHAMMNSANGKPSWWMRRIGNNENHIQSAMGKEII